MEHNHVDPQDVSPDVPLRDLTVFARPDLRVGEPATPVRKRSRVREWIESLVFTIFFVFIFTSYVAQATQVPTESMKPTILVGDHFFLDKLAFPANYPKFLRLYLPRRSLDRGDIIAFRAPIEGDIPFVKRVVAVPGDAIELRNKELYVNGEHVEEPYKIHLDPVTYEENPWTPEELTIRDNYGPAVVPDSSYFVMGDNRDNSNDSRYWGFIHRDDVIGKPLFVYWSYESDPYVPGNPAFSEWVRDYASVAIHFFSKTRWFRIGTAVE